MPVVWSRVGYADDASDAGVWGARTDTPDSLQNIKYGSDRHAYDERCDIRPGDTQFTKRMPSAFFETPLQSLLVWHRVDTVVVTGGSTSGCVRATAVDALTADSAEALDLDRFAAHVRAGAGSSAHSRCRSGLRLSWCVCRRSGQRSGWPTTPSRRSRLQPKSGRAICSAISAARRSRSRSRRVRRRRW
jgi:hypothetical protein